MPYRPLVSVTFSVRLRIMLHRVFHGSSIFDVYTAVGNNKQKQRYMMNGDHLSAPFLFFFFSASTSLDEPSTTSELSSPQCFSALLPSAFIENHLRTEEFFDKEKGVAPPPNNIFGTIFQPTSSRHLQVQVVSSCLTFPSEPEFATHYIKNPDVFQAGN